MLINLFYSKLDEPQLSASVGDTFHVFFYLQREQSYHIANKGNFHLSRNKRKLHAVSKSIQNYEFFSPSTTRTISIGKKEFAEFGSYTWCVFTDITAGNIAGICKTDPYVSASKLVAHVNLSIRSTVSIVVKCDQDNLKA